MGSKKEKNCCSNWSLKQKKKNISENLCDDNAWTYCLKHNRSNLCFYSLTNTKCKNLTNILQGTHQLKKLQNNSNDLKFTSIEHTLNSIFVCIDQANENSGSLERSNKWNNPWKLFLKDFDQQKSFNLIIYQQWHQDFNPKQKILMIGRKKVQKFISSTQRNQTFHFISEESRKILATEHSESLLFVKQFEDQRFQNQWRWNQNWSTNKNTKKTCKILQNRYIQQVTTYFYFYKFFTLWRQFIQQTKHFNICSA